MEVLDIRDYIWNVFEIATYHDTTTIQYALDMFLANVDLGLERYEVAYDVSYARLHKRWNRMANTEKDFQKMIFNKIIRYSYICLYDTWVLDDREEFDRLAHMRNLHELGMSEVDPNNVRLEACIKRYSKDKQKKKRRKRKYKQF